ncbi:MAG: hypothetical protein LC779_16340 [Actinobacteria bacterium]|nr:hypothetical protein [Actinomycetota bacterium]
MTLRSLLTLLARVAAGVAGAVLLAWGLTMLLRALRAETDNTPAVTAALGGLAVLPGIGLLWVACGTAFAAWLPADEVAAATDDQRHDERAS